MKKALFVFFLLCIALPTFADDYASIQAKKFKIQVSMINKIYDEVYKRFGYETRVSIWLSVCGQDVLSKAVTPSNNALDKFIATKLDDQIMLGRKLTDMERLRAGLAIKSMYAGYSLGFKEATYNHYEDLLKIDKDASIDSAVNAANKILERK
jgi:hypothetical protein